MQRPSEEFDALVEKLAKRKDWITDVSVQDAAQPGNDSKFPFDLIHPSHKSDRVIGQRIARFIRQSIT